MSHTEIKRLSSKKFFNSHISVNNILKGNIINEHVRGRKDSQKAHLEKKLNLNQNFSSSIFRQIFIAQEFRNKSLN